jgi:2,3-bisphosphoglycerate-independent phosphoglycerate mutase
MKSVIFLGDGMSDYPVPELGGKTPLQAAKKPNMDRIAREGRTGLLQTVLPHQSQGSAVANLAVLGYDPDEVYNGRAVLEAANMGVELAPDDVALRCNLICVEGGRIKNHSAGHITSEEAAILIADLDRVLGGDHNGVTVRFFSGVSYRHLTVLTGKSASPALILAPPHDHVGETVESLAPKAKIAEAEATARLLIDLLARAEAFLKDHPVNKKRIAAGKDAANSVWFWSAGRKPVMKTFQERFGVHGAVISAVDLVMGLGLYAGMDVVRVEGATGLWDTNYEGKADACLKALDTHDFVYVHVEATDEAGHARDLAMKIKCIEMLDERLIGWVLSGIERKGLQCRVSVLPDHPTPVSTGVHARDPVPVAVWTPGETRDSSSAYDEEQAKQGALGLLKKDEFIKLALGIGRD